MAPSSPQRSTLDLVSAEDVLSLLQKATRVGGDPALILATAQAPFALADLSSGAVRIVSRRLMAAIYRECIVTIGWHSSRLDNRPQMHPDEFQLMCHCVITCRTLADVIARQAMFFRTRGERLSTIELTIDRGVATIKVDTMRRRKTFGVFLSDLAGMSMFCRFYAWLTGMGVYVFRVGLAYGPPFTEEPVADFFAGELSFNQAVNTISLPERLLDMPVLRTPGDLDVLLQRFPFDFMASDPAELKVSDRIRGLYSLALTRDRAPPTLEQLAVLTGLSMSTLRRRLTEEGVSIRGLKDAARRHAALELIQERHRTADEIASRIGFRDVDSFRAAFRRWTGVSPDRYRRMG